MHIVVLFYNIGGYHAARLRAAYQVCQEKGWQLTAIQVTDNTKEHPWGSIENEITFSIHTLLPIDTTDYSIDRSFSSPLAASLITGYLEKIKPNVVVIPGWGFPISRSALFWCKRNHIPAILMSESKWDDEKRFWWKEQLKSWLYVRKYDAAIVGGKLHHDYLIKLGFPAEKIFFGYDVVDNDYFTKGADAARQNPTATREYQPKIPAKPYFLVVTRLIKRKNVLNLVKAFSVYRQQVKENEAWDLVICGSGEEEETICNLIVAKGLNHCVHLPGFVTYQEVVYWYGLAAAFIHPALQEQWGLVVNEACAARLPVLVSRKCGSFSDLVVEEKNGFGFDPHNIKQIAQLMIQLSSIGIDLHGMGKFSFDHIQKYSPQVFAESFYNSVKSVTSN
ncbi:MAG: glycosyltransferase [Sphaerospermopsis sp. SIO1G1]|nr:glycosyltransferase [Sphaerospermopsis sp. SIO1G1]